MTNIQAQQNNQHTSPTIPPAQLWIGATDTVCDATKEYIQKVFCSRNGCNTCTTCAHIRDEQHHGVMWVQPEKRYTLDTLAPLFERIAFTLDTSEHFFFIIQSADFLTTACANALLKSIEEPPAGYHFILLAQRLEQILPTIRSRCVIKKFESVDDSFTKHPLFPFFIGHYHCPIEFAKKLESSKISDKESIELFDTLLIHWIARYKNATKQKNALHQARARKMIDILQRTSKTMPMPGSSKLFWKNIFITINHTKQTTQ